MDRGYPGIDSCRFHVCGSICIVDFLPSEADPSPDTDQTRQSYGRCIAKLALVSIIIFV
jgi:hypothetical protein